MYLFPKQISFKLRFKPYKIWLGKLAGQEIEKPTFNVKGTSKKLKNFIIIFVLLCSPSYASPVFKDFSNNLPHHIYSGEWNHFVGGGVAVMDCNGDSLPDFFAAGGTEPAALFTNTGEFNFIKSNIPDLFDTTGAYPIDINADGHIDLFVLRIGPNVVLKGNANCEFVDATNEFQIPNTSQWSTAFSAWWSDDKLPHMVIGNYVDLGDPDGPFFACDSNQVLEPTGDGYITQKLEPGFCALSMLAARDASGIMRLRISNDRQYYVRNGYEQMWDIAEERFLTEIDGWKKVSIWGMGIASRDITGDGRDEVFLTSMGDQLLQIAQEDGTYTAAPFEIGTYAHRPYFGDDGRPSTGWHAQFGDVNNDGRSDLFISKGNVDQMPSNAIYDPNNLLIQKSDGTFVEVGLLAGIASKERSRGAALADFDLDGRLDILVLNRRAPLQIYRNETEKVGHWLKVKLTQVGGNFDAVGALVKVGEDVQQITIGGGHAGGQSLPLHFGLGSSTAVNITVTWPDGAVSTHNANADQTVKLHR